MGSDAPEAVPEDREGPVREVAVGPFEMSSYAVTNAQFADFVRETSYFTTAERDGWSFVFRGRISPERAERVGRVPADTPWWLPIPGAYWAQPEGPGSTVLDRLDHPVVHVSWHDAEAYCAWAGTALPSEVHWEYAARGGIEGARYPWGDDLTPGGLHRCNIWQGSFPDHDTGADGYAGTAPVHAFPPNGFGLFNMTGNVWEWCADAFDPTAPPEHAPRALRGGSYLCHRSYCNRYRVSARSGNAPDTSSGNIGFRVIR